MSYVLIVGFIAIFAYSLEQAFKFREIRSDDSIDRVVWNSWWHVAQAVQQLCLYFLIYLLSNIQLAFLFAAVYWIVFDWVVHVVGLEQGWWYMGNTGEIDKYFRNTFNRPALVYYGFKFLVLGIAIVLFIVKLNS